MEAGFDFDFDKDCQYCKVGRERDSWESILDLVCLRCGCTFGRHMSNHPHACAEGHLCSAFTEVFYKYPRTATAEEIYEMLREG